MFGEVICLRGIEDSSFTLSTSEIPLAHVTNDRLPRPQSWEKRKGIALKPSNLPFNSSTAFESTTKSKISSFVQGGS